jgi:hypothetical protein
MADSQYIVVEVTLLESTGPFKTVGVPRMFCRYSAVHVPGTDLDDGRVCVVVRDDATQSWREYARRTTFDEARDVVAQLEALRMPGRTPEVKGIIDTSDGWTNLFFRVQGERDVTALDIGMESSGFDGADAERLRTLFRYLFALAGFEAYCPVVYGQRLGRRCT